MRDKNCPNLNRDLEISVARSCPILCEPLDCNPPGTFVHGILQARRLEWVAMPPSRGSSRPRDGTHISCTGRQILYHLSPTGSPKEEVALGIHHTLHPVFLVASRAPEQIRGRFLNYRDKLGFLLLNDGTVRTIFVKHASSNQDAGNGLPAAKHFIFFPSKLNYRVGLHFCEFRASRSSFN